MKSFGTLEIYDSHNYKNSNNNNNNNNNNISISFLLPLTLKEQNILKLDPKDGPIYECIPETFIEDYTTIRDLQKIRLLNKENMIKEYLMLITCYEDTPKIPLKTLIETVPNLEALIEEYLNLRKDARKSTESKLVKATIKIRERELIEPMTTITLDTINILNENDKTEITDYLNYHIFIDSLVDIFNKDYLSELNTFFDDDRFKGKQTSLNLINKDSKRLLNK